MKVVLCTIFGRCNYGSTEEKSIEGSQRQETF